MAESILSIVEIDFNIYIDMCTYYLGCRAWAGCCQSSSWLIRSISWDERDN